MARMMNKTCSRGCCSTGGPGRPAEKIVWLHEWVNGELPEAVQDEYVWRAARRRYN